MWQTSVRCTATQLLRSSTGPPPNLEKEPHKYFDQVVITVRAGDGGHGAVLSLPRASARGENRLKKKDKDEQRKKRKFKRETDGTVILPMGGHGGDVIVYANESEDTLLEYHKKKKYYAKRGGNVDAMGYLTPSIEDGVSAPTLRIPVPVGTVVKRKRGGKLLADLVRPGDEVLVARGGRGGISMLEVPKTNKAHLHPAVTAPTMNDPDDKALVLGASGEEIALELTLRVVADVGLVGFPNAGKSSLLAAVTRAKPEIAEYPFTTLMPNLGHLNGDPEKEDGGFSKGPMMADLPGLIKGAHLGKGLGRMFLRHLRRTRIVVHVVDASLEDPLQDYKVLREELLMYNPDYLRRPHIVVLNKLDIPEAKERFESIRGQILQSGTYVSNISSPLDSETDKSIDQSDVEMSDDTARSNERSNWSPDQERDIDEYPCAAEVVGISALQGFGIESLLKTIRSLLQSSNSSNGKAKKGKLHQSGRQLYNPPQWEI